MIPHLYNGRDQTFYFLEYQGFRQVLGATEVIPVPTAAERAGLDTTAFPGDTLIVPVNPRHRETPGPLSAAERSARSLRRAHLCHVLESDHGLGSVLRARRSQDLGQSAAVRALHHGEHRRAHHQPEPDRDRPDFRRRVRRPPAQRGHHVTRARHPPSLALRTSISFTRTTPSFPTLNRTDPGADLRRRPVRGVQRGRGIGDRVVRQSLSSAAELRVDPREAHLQSRRRSPGESRHHGVRHQSERRISVRRWHGVLAGRDPFGERRARHSPRRSAARFADRPADRQRLHLHHRGRAAAVRAGRSHRRFGHSPRRVQRVLPGQLEDIRSPAAQLRAALRDRLAHSRARQTDIGVRCWAARRRDPPCCINPPPAYSLDKNGWGPRVAAEWRVAGNTLLAPAPASPRCWRISSRTTI